MKNKESFSKGTASNKAVIIVLRVDTLPIVLKGRSTRITLSDAKLKLEPVSIKSYRYALDTIIKSKIFIYCLIKLFSFKINPIPNIFNAISKV